MAICEVQKVLQMAICDVQKALASVALILGLTSSRVAMTLQAGLGLTTYKTYDKSGDLSISGHDTTLTALSTIHCAIQCRKFPYCTSFAYNAQASTCLLSSQTSAIGDGADLSNNASKQWSVYTDTAPDCQKPALNITHGSVAMQRSLWAVNGSVICDDDYYLPQNVTSAVTCLSDGSWTPFDAKCVKRVWRYPETKQNTNESLKFELPDPVTVGWSVCVEGSPTKSTVFQIEFCTSASCNDQSIHTAWRFYPTYTRSVLVVNDRINGTWGTETAVYSPPFPLKVGEPFNFKLTASSSTTVDVYMNNQYFTRRQLRLSLSTFSLISIRYDVNVTKVDVWCRN